MQQIKLLLMLAVQIRMGYCPIQEIDIENMDQTFTRSKIRINGIYTHNKESRRIADVLLGTLRLMA